jgi:hypothetical protein
MRTPFKRGLQRHGVPLALLLVSLSVPLRTVASGVVGTGTPANVWTRLSPTESVRHYPAHWVDCSPSVTSGNPVGRSFSSMINGPSGTLLYWGGAHGSNPGNNAELFDTATQTWTEQFAPECLEACCRVCSLNTSIDCVTDTDCAGNGTCGSSSPQCATRGRCAVPLCSCIVMNGSGSTQITTGNRPFSEEVYSAYTYNANASRQHYLLSLRGGVWSYSPPDIWTLLTTTQPALASSPWGWSKLLAYDPTVTCGSETGAVLGFFNKGADKGGIYCFDYGTAAWVPFDTSATAWPPGFNGREISGTWDSTRNEHIISDSRTAVWRYKASTKTWTNTNAPAGALNTISYYYNTAVAYDASHDITLALKPIAGSSPDMWQYDNATGVWSDIDDTQLGTLPPGTSGSAKWNTLRYDGGIFYFLSVGAGASGTGGPPDRLDTLGTTTWTFQWNNPPLVGAGTATPTPTPAGGVATPTGTPQPTVPFATPTNTSAPTTTVPPARPTPTATSAGMPSATPTRGFCPAGSNQSIFAVAASGDDGQARHYDYGPTYPPMAGKDQNSSNTYLVAQRSFTGTYYATTVGLMRWNTAQQPDGTAWPANTLVTGAYFRPRYAATGNQTVNNDTLVLQWYAWTPPISDAYWTNAVPSSGDASYAGADTIANYADYHNTPLTNLSQINLSGYTGIRAGISGGQPTGNNVAQWYTWDYSGGLIPEQLVVCWTTVTPTPTSGVTTPTNVPLPTNTPTPTVTPTAALTPAVTPTPAPTCVANLGVCAVDGDCCSLNCTAFVCTGPTQTPTNIPTLTQTPTIINTPTATPTNAFCPRGQTESIFVAATSTDECTVTRYDYTPAYPPQGIIIVNCTYHTTIPTRQYYNSTSGYAYAVGNALARWNTATQPSGAAWPAGTTVVAAFSNIRHPAADTSPDGDSLVFEWYPWTSASTADYAVGYPASGNPTYAGIDPISNSPWWHTVALTHVDQVNLSGYTGIRTSVNGGQPTGGNAAQLYDIRYDVGELAQQLIVCSVVETPTAAPTIVDTPTPTSTPNYTPTETPAATPTEILTGTPAETPATTPTASPEAAPSVTPTSTSTSTSTATPTSANTPTPRATSTGAPSATPTRAFCQAGQNESIFNVAASGDDGTARRYDYGPTYPPAASNDQKRSSTYLVFERSLDGGGSYYATSVGLIRWNTATQPDGTVWPANTVVTGAFFRPRYYSSGNSTVNGDTMVFEWYTWTPPISNGYWTNNVPASGDATYAGGDTIANYAGYHGTALTHVGQINLSG